MSWKKQKQYAVTRDSDSSLHVSAQMYLYMYIHPNLSALGFDDDGREALQELVAVLRASKGGGHGAARLAPQR